MDQKIKQAEIKMAIMQQVPNYRKEKPDNVTIMYKLKNDEDIDNIDEVFKEFLRGLK